MTQYNEDKEEGKFCSVVIVVMGSCVQRRPLLSEWEKKGREIPTRVTWEGVRAEVIDRHIT